MSALARYDWLLTFSDGSRWFRAPNPADVLRLISQATAQRMDRRPFHPRAGDSSMPLDERKAFDGPFRLSISLPPRPSSKRIGPHPAVTVINTVLWIAIAWLRVGSLPWTLGAGLIIGLIGVQSIQGWRRANSWRARALLAEAKRRDKGPYRTAFNSLEKTVDEWPKEDGGGPWPPSDLGLDKFARRLRDCGVSAEQFAAAMRRVRGTEVEPIAPFPPPPSLPTGIEVEDGKIKWTHQKVQK